MRFQRDRHLVAEASLHSGADRPEEPRRRGRYTQADGRAKHQALSVFQYALAEQHQPQCEQRIWKRGELRQHKRRKHQPRLVAVSERAQPPHRGQRGWQIARRVEHAVAARLN
jgi:hypothetical protein